jgi:hypothetical protein
VANSTPHLRPDKRETQCDAPGAKDFFHGYRICDGTRRT